MEMDQQDSGSKLKPVEVKRGDVKETYTQKGQGLWGTITAAGIVEIQNQSFACISGSSGVSTSSECLQFGIPPIKCIQNEQKHWWVRHISITPWDIGLPIDVVEIWGSLNDSKDFHVLVLWNKELDKET